MRVLQDGGIQASQIKISQEASIQTVLQVSAKIHACSPYVVNDNCAARGRVFALQHATHILARAANETGGMLGQTQLATAHRRLI